MKEKIRKNRKFWFKVYKAILRIFYRKPKKFVYLGDEFETRSLVLSNHLGAFTPMTIELYLKKYMRFWGTHEMNDGLKSSYKYLSTEHFQVRRKFSPRKAKFLAVIAAPLTTIFYKGLRLIPTYTDARLRGTIVESLKAIEEGQNLIIFPENITEGYYEELTGFHAGFLVLAEKAYKKGYDLPIYVSYYQQKNRIFVIDKKVMYSELMNSGLSREEICQKLCDRCNELGKMKIEL